jgi:Pyruvate/2-oxoacid:ferredoxin oxidoreductase delta subunit
MSQKIIGPDLKDLHSFQDLPIGATITGMGAVTARTGTWRFYRPRLREALAPCQSACPAGVDIRGFVSLIRQKKYKEAFKNYTLENPFPGLCSISCDHPCEQDCLRKLYDGAIAIRELEHFLSSRGSFPEMVSRSKGPAKKIVVVGRNLEELSTIYFLRQLGHSVVLSLGGMALETLYEDVLSTYKMPADSPWKKEIKRVLEADSSIKVETDPLPDRPEQFDAAVWGLEAEPAFAHSRLFLLRIHTSAVAQAIGKGKEAAIAVDLWLKNLDLEAHRHTIALGPSRFLSFARYVNMSADGTLTEPQPVHFEELNTRSFKRETEIGTSGMKNDPKRAPLNEDKAIKEARRCFQCGRCTLCGQCTTYCPEQAVQSDTRQKRVTFDYGFCKGCGICAYECPRGAICFVKEETGWR